MFRPILPTGALRVGQPNEIRLSGPPCPTCGGKARNVRWLMRGFGGPVIACSLTDEAGHDWTAPPDKVVVELIYRPTA